MPGKKMTRRKMPRDFAIRLTELVDEEGGNIAVAYELRVHPFTLRTWCDGAREPSLYWLCILAIYFGLTPNELLGVRKGKTVEAQRLGAAELFSEIRRARRLDDGAPHDRLHRIRARYFREAAREGVTVRELMRRREIENIYDEYEEANANDEFPIKVIRSIDGDGREIDSRRGGRFSVHFFRSRGDADGPGEAGGGPAGGGGGSDP